MPGDWGVRRKWGEDHSGGQQGASVEDRASGSEAAGVQDRGGPRAPECPCPGWGRERRETTLAGGRWGVRQQTEGGGQAAARCGEQDTLRARWGRVLGLTGHRVPEPWAWQACCSEARTGWPCAAVAHGVGAGHEQPPSTGTWGHPPSARLGHRHGTRCPAFRHRAVLSSQAHKSRAPNADSGQPGMMSCEPYFSPLFLNH